MMKVFTHRFLPVAIVILAMGGMVLVSPQTVQAAAKEDICAGVGLATGGTGCDVPGGSPTIDSVVTAVVNTLSVIVGITAVIMIIIGGFKYVTSTGDANNVSSAKNTILYAIVGLVVVALAQIIVRFVLHKTTLPSCKPGQTEIKKPGDCVVQP